MSDEHELNIARREAEQIASSEAYFAARHWSNDSIQSRKVFEAGFERAWESQRARHAALEAELARYEGALRMVGVLKQLGGMMPGSKQIVDSVVEECAAALKPTKEG